MILVWEQGFQYGNSDIGMGYSDIGMRYIDICMGCSDIGMGTVISVWEQ